MRQINQSTIKQDANNKNKRPARQILNLMSRAQRREFEQNKNIQNISNLQDKSNISTNKQVIQTPKPQQRRIRDPARHVKRQEDYDYEQFDDQVYVVPKRIIKNKTRPAAVQSIPYRAINSSMLYSGSNSKYIENSYQQQQQDSYQQVKPKRQYNKRSKSKDKKQTKTKDQKGSKQQKQKQSYEPSLEQIVQSSQENSTSYIQNNPNINNNKNTNNRRINVNNRNNLPQNDQQPQHNTNDQSYYNNNLNEDIQIDNIYNSKTLTLPIDKQNGSKGKPIQRNHIQRDRNISRQKDNRNKQEQNVKNKNNQKSTLQKNIQKQTYKQKSQKQKASGKQYKSINTRAKFNTLNIQTNRQQKNNNKKNKPNKQYKNNKNNKTTEQNNNKIKQKPIKINNQQDYQNNNQYDQSYYQQQDLLNKSIQSIISKNISKFNQQSLNYNHQINHQYNNQQSSQFNSHPKKKNKTHSKQLSYAKTIALWGLTNTSFLNKNFSQKEKYQFMQALKQVDRLNIKYGRYDPIHPPDIGRLTDQYYQFQKTILHYKKVQQAMDTNLIPVLLPSIQTAPIQPKKITKPSQQQDYRQKILKHNDQQQIKQYAMNESKWWQQQQSQPLQIINEDRIQTIRYKQDIYDYYQNGIANINNLKYINKMGNHLQKDNNEDQQNSENDDQQQKEKYQKKLKNNSRFKNGIINQQIRKYPSFKILDNYYYKAYDQKYKIFSDCIQIDMKYEQLLLQSMIYIYPKQVEQVFHLNYDDQISQQSQQYLQQSRYGIQQRQQYRNNKNKYLSPEEIIKFINNFNQGFATIQQRLRNNPYEEAYQRMHNQYGSQQYSQDQSNQSQQVKNQWDLVQRFKQYKPSQINQTLNSYSALYDKYIQQYGDYSVSLQLDEQQYLEEINDQITRQNRQQIKDDLWRLFNQPSIYHDYSQLNHSSQQPQIRGNEEKRQTKNEIRNQYTNSTNNNRNKKERETTNNQQIKNTKLNKNRK